MIYVILAIIAIVSIICAIVARNQISNSKDEEEKKNTTHKWQVICGFIGALVIIVFAIYIFVFF